MSVVIVDYGSGNLRSVAKAVERAIAEAGSAETVTVTADAAAVAGAGRLVLPGVGAFGDCMEGLAALPGMLEALGAAVIQGGKPFLGICVGMELLAEMGREHGDNAGLGWVPGEVAALAPADAALKIPHMGWNELVIPGPSHPVFAGIEPGAHAYFVHSYGFLCANPAHILATVDYGGPVTAAVGRDNMVGTQFHPEKSQATGLRLITNFLRWRP